MAWGAIFSALEIEPGQSILEYGPGSGQALLMLARTGVRAFGVDIDAESLDLVRRQSEAMDLGVQLQQAGFGDGFPGMRFDRILFFEAFHHSLEFDTLLLRLHDQLNEGGRLILAGEPVVHGYHGAVPYPWGPRMDALSVMCMRRYGWMELGFHMPFLVELLMRTGWVVQFRENPVYRAWLFIAEPIKGDIAIGGHISLPGPGWEIGEGTHRWTLAESVRFPLPDRKHPCIDLVVEVANYLPQPKIVSLTAGSQIVEAILVPGDSCVFSIHGVSGAAALTLSAALSKSPTDDRNLGVAVKRVAIEPSAPPAHATLPTAVSTIFARSIAISASVDGPIAPRSPSAVNHPLAEQISVEVPEGGVSASPSGSRDAAEAAAGGIGQAAVESAPAASSAIDGNTESPSAMETVSANGSPGGASEPAGGKQENGLRARTPKARGPKKPKD